MKDEKIRYRPAERAAVIAHDVSAFYLTSGNLSGRRMAELFITHRDRIWALAAEPHVGLFAVSSRASGRSTCDQVGRFGAGLR